MEPWLLNVSAVHLPKRLELLFLSVFALPNPSVTGLAWNRMGCDGRNKRSCFYAVLPSTSDQWNVYLQNKLLNRYIIRGSLTSRFGTSFGKILQDQFHRFGLCAKQKKLNHINRCTGKHHKYLFCFVFLPCQLHFPQRYTQPDSGARIPKEQQKIKLES